MNDGVFTFINLIIWGGLLFALLYKLTANKKKCPHCQSQIDNKATVCPKCTRELPTSAPAQKIETLGMVVVECPQCHVKEEVKRSEMGIFEYKNFLMSYSAFWGIMKFECKSCKRTFRYNPSTKEFS